MDQKPLYHLVANIDLSDTARTVEEALGECERELGVRDRCFGAWVEKGTLNRNDARDRMQRMARACQLLQLLLKLPPEQLEQMEAQFILATAQS